jgi:hypothetical protein
VVPAVSAALGRQVQEALGATFKASVIPGFERATQVGRGAGGDGCWRAFKRTRASQGWLARTPGEAVASHTACSLCSSLFTCTCQDWVPRSATTL